MVFPVYMGRIPKACCPGSFGQILHMLTILQSHAKLALSWHTMLADENRLQWTWVCYSLCSGLLLNKRPYSQRPYWLILVPRKDQTQQLLHDVARRVLHPTSMLPDENSVRSALRMSPKSKNVKLDIKSLNQTARSDFFFAMPLLLREENW